MEHCVDYRKLNAATRKDAYPIPRIDDTLDTLAGSQWFSTLDLISGYWQVKLDDNDRHKTAFSAPDGLFEFNVMPFGLCNAPATFQRLMDMVLAGMNWKTCLVYLDDIIILGKDFPTHLCNIRLPQKGRIETSTGQMQALPASCRIPRAHHLPSGDCNGPRENRTGNNVASTSLQTRRPAIPGTDQLLPPVYTELCPYCKTSQPSDGKDSHIQVDRTMPTSL